ncbi:hypothetical protein JQ636_40530 [Bradyrhizobium japonicum]|uniref:hypothetical protein n=1 Tax=Bradyrhizobium japonicum TaxID=375 RepID=UPI001BAA27C3|nr:hypothetical protein [Bradyrhizobium japonicum]MBR0731087.1 hypothetical protein [Bradyrhizobium japonicum]MBR0809845.1 hypothetical protein [Bradyrhizobium japonicum]
MPQQQVIWTSLPNGRRRIATGERLKLSVAVSPRLRLDDEATGTLGSFSDFVDWPAHLRQNLVGFDLVVDDDEAHPLAATVVTADPPDSDLWRALFTGATPVRSQKLEEIREPIATYPAGTVALQLSTGYGKMCGETPFRPADKATFKRNFADLVQAVQPARPESVTAMRAGLSTARSTGALGHVHRELATSLLEVDASFTFNEKLADVTEVAGALARAAAPGQLVPLVPDNGQAGIAFTQFAAFHRRADRRVGLETADASPGRNPVEDVDFHRMLSALGDYPWLLRRLGLVIDLEVDAALVPKSSIGSLRQLRVRPQLSSPSDAAANYTPATKYIFDDAITSPLPFPVFVAAPKRAAEPPDPTSTLEILAGLLNLRLLLRPPPADDLQFDIISIDIDGAVKKIINAIESIVRDEQKPNGPIGSTSGGPPPTIRTQGLTLVRAGHADQLMAGVSTAQTLEADRTAGRRAVLFAEDLVRGYRIDVRRFPRGQQPILSDQPWLSLHQRIGTFRFKRNGQSDIVLANVADEGFVQPVLTQDARADSGGTSPIYIHESYGRWNGWSLSVPFPIAPLDLTAKQQDPVGPPAGLLNLDVDMAIAPATLPQLRFGNRYQMRVRTVDLAGNGLSVDEATNDVMVALATNNRPELHLPLRPEELPFRRFEPIASPVLVLGEELLEGESVDTMVIRSDGPPTTTASYALGLRDRRYKGFNDRHVVPPRSSQYMAELHGRLDAAFGPAGDTLKVFNICRRDAGSINDPFVINIRTGEREDLPDVVRTDPLTGAQTRIPHGIGFFNIETSSAAPAIGPLPSQPKPGYVVHCEEQFRLPYLPDPLAQGAALFGLPGLIENNESLILAEGSGPGNPARLESKTGSDQLLPQRAIDELGLVTKIGFPRAGEWPELHCFRLRLDGLHPGARAAPEWSEVNGARLLTVRLAPAEVREIWISTYPAKEDVELFGLHFWWDRLGASAANREFMNMAQHGALAALSPARKILLVHAVQRPLREPQNDSTPFAARKFPEQTAANIAGSFKIHGGSTEKLDLLASWTEPLQGAEATRSINTHVLEIPIHLDQQSPSIAGDTVPIGSYFKGTDRFEFHAPDRQEDSRSRTWLARHEFGDTRHRRVTYQLVATTRFKEYFPESITRDTQNIVRTSTFKDIIVQNSTRPPALEITRIVPAFKLERDFQLTSSARTGGWLRVYLGPQWFATGEAEALAVIGQPVAGADPIHATSSSTSRNTIRPKGPEAITVARPDQPSVEVFPFPVHHDPELGLWYSDLAFDVTGSYFPFIGLRLARFQEHSLPGIQLSSVVEAGLYQLLPDRTVSMARRIDDQLNKRRIDIAVSGTSAPAAALSSGPRLTYSIEIDIEERALGGPDDQRDKDLGWKRSAAVVPVVDTAPAPALWKGHVLLPLVADMDRRIVIKEFEQFPRNDPPPGQAWADQPTGGPSRRLVYADVISVTTDPGE